MILQSKYIEDDEILAYLEENETTLENAAKQGLSKKGTAFSLAKLIDGKENMNITKHLLRRFEALCKLEMPKHEKVYRVHESDFEIVLAHFVNNKKIRRRNWEQTS